MNHRRSRRVSKRKVFYIPGFDPKPPRRYRELYRDEGETQSEFSGYDLKVGPRKGQGFGWLVESEIDGQPVRTDMEVLVWSDIVRSNMGKKLPATFWAALKTIWIYVASGAFRRLAWLRKGPILAALYPFAAIFLQFGVALGISASVGSILAGSIAALAAGISALGFTGIAGWGVWPLLGNMLWWAATLAGTVILLRFFRSFDHKLFAHYLVLDYAYASGRYGAYPPELHERMQAFADKIAQALASDADEVLVVGHSSGAQLAVSILAELIRDDRVPANGPALSLLTLGQAIPMISFLPKADRLRADLHDLSRTDQATWVDVSAPGDGCSFALCDPVAVTGVSPPDQRWPLVLSAAFSQTLQPETWRRLRWRFFRLHYQYLCAFDNPGDYDYFQITAGPITLGARFADRKSSMNRIDVPASAYTSRAA